MQSHSCSIGSLILLPEIFEMIQKIKIPKSDLYNLRTVSSSYYKTFNSIYLKRLNRSVHFEIYLKQHETKGQAQVSILNKLDHPKKIISNGNQNELMKFGYLFRKITIVWNNYHDVNIPRGEFIQLDPIICSLGPYINEIELQFYPSPEFQSTKTMQSLTPFLKECINLKKINFTRAIEFIPITELNLFLANLKSNIQVYLTLWGDLLLEALLAKSNLFFNIRLELRENISVFQHMLKKYEEFIPARIKFYLVISSISSVEEIMRLTKVCLENQKCIKHLQLYIFPDPQQLTRIENRDIVEQCLLKLSGIINDLTLSQDSEVKLDLLRGIPIWPKLTLLDIRGYEHRLDILKRCPKIKHLYLRVNWDSCILHNHQNTEEENLQDYFGHLKKLKAINLYGLGEKAENIKAKLKKIVPPYPGFYRLESNY